MRKYIQNIAPKAVSDSFTTQLNSIIAGFNNYKINLSNDEKLGTRSMSEGREGYVRLVSRVANQYPTALGRADTPIDLSNLLDYYQNLESNRLAILQALETIQEIQLGAATDIMEMTDRYVKSLQIARDNEASLDMAMQEVDDWNKRFGARTGGNQ